MFKIDSGKNIKNGKVNLISTVYRSYLGNNFCQKSIAYTSKFVIDRLGLKYLNIVVVSKRNDKLNIQRYSYDYYHLNLIYYNINEFFLETNNKEIVNTRKDIFLDLMNFLKQPYLSIYLDKGYL